MSTTHEEREKMIWTTKDGRELAITELDDSHLINIIKLLRRTVMGQQLSMLNSGMRALEFLQGEMAQDSVEREMDEITDMEPIEFLILKNGAYEPLLEEAISRDLNEDDEDISDLAEEVRQWYDQTGVEAPF